jgi:dTDP-4-dehydrorhamnose 3,5-epimerase
MKQVPIDGLKITLLKEIADRRGSVLHILRSDSHDFTTFGECYCSETLPGAVKAWKRHRLQTQNFSVPVGKLRLVLFDDRENSRTKGAVSVVELGRPDHYARVTIPPGIWYGFSALGSAPALIVNCADIPHEPGESERLAENDTGIPYDWAANSRNR